MVDLEQLGNPYQSDIDALKALEDERRKLMLSKQKESLAEPDNSWRNVIAQAILTLAPAALGAAISGKEGGLVGFQAGEAGGDRFLQSVAQEQARRQGLAALEAQTAQGELEAAQKQKAELEKENRSRVKSLELEDIKQANRLELEGQRQKRGPSTVVNTGNKDVSEDRVLAFAQAANTVDYIKKEVLPIVDKIPDVDGTNIFKTGIQRLIKNPMSPEGETEIILSSLAVALARAEQPGALIEEDILRKQYELMGGILADGKTSRRFIQRTLERIASNLDSQLGALGASRADPTQIDRLRENLLPKIADYLPGGQEYVGAENRDKAMFSPSVKGSTPKASDFEDDNALAEFLRN